MCYVSSNFSLKNLEIDLRIYIALYYYYYLVQNDRNAPKRSQPILSRSGQGK